MSPELHEQSSVEQLTLAVRKMHDQAYDCAVNMAEKTNGVASLIAVANFWNVSPK